MCRKTNNTVKKTRNIIFQRVLLNVPKILFIKKGASETTFQLEKTNVFKIGGGGSKIVATYLAFWVLIDIDLRF